MSTEEARHLVDGAEPCKRPLQLLRGRALLVLGFDSNPMQDERPAPTHADVWIVRLLREARARSGLPRAELARRLRLPEDVLAKLEAGDTSAAPAPVLRRLAVALSVAFADA